MKFFNSSLHNIQPINRYNTNYFDTSLFKQLGIIDEHARDCIYFDGKLRFCKVENRINPY